MLTLSFKLLSNSRLSGHKIQLTRRLRSEVNDAHCSVVRSIDMFISGRCFLVQRSSTCSKNRRVRLSENLWLISVIYVQEEAETGQEVGWPTDPTHPSPVESSPRDFTFWLIRIICLDYFDIGVWPIRLRFLPSQVFCCPSITDS